jgi:hypothetical protein
MTETLDTVERQCRATNRAGERCGRSAIPGGVVCSFHGGKSPQVMAAAERRLQESTARAQCRRLGVPDDTAEPGTVLLQGVKEWAGNCAFYRELAQQLDPGLTRREIGDDTAPQLIEGIVTRTFHPSGRPTGTAEVHTYVRLYAEAWDRLRQFAEAALKAGVEERLLRLEEKEVETLFAGLAAGISAAGLSVEQSEKLKRAFASHLRGAGAESAALEAGEREVFPMGVASEESVPRRKVGLPRGGAEGCQSL